MIDVKTEIICKNFQHKKIKNNKIIVNDESSEYYIVPLSDDFTMESDDEVIKLTFKNQLLWLLYSNHWKEILVKDFNFNECVLIKSEDILDVEVKITCGENYFRKNVYHSMNKPHMNKKFRNKYMLAIPIFDDMININEVGVNIVQIRLLTNEILLRKIVPNKNNHGYFPLTSNFLLNQEALFIPLSCDDVSSFLEKSIEK